VVNRRHFTQDHKNSRRFPGFPEVVDTLITETRTTMSHVPAWPGTLVMQRTRDEQTWKLSNTSPGWLTSMTFTSLQFWPATATQTTDDFRSFSISLRSFSRSFTFIIALCTTHSISLVQVLNNINTAMRHQICDQHANFTHSSSTAT